MSVPRMYKPGLTVGCTISIKRAKLGNSKDRGLAHREYIYTIGLRLGSIIIHRAATYIYLYILLSMSQ